jgi:predicted SnoaL-like aldol condensation-catalyzing enzyme
MINQLEIPMYLEEAIPEISNELNEGKKYNAFVLMNSLVLFTYKNIKAHNYKTVKKCFKVADKLYSKGNGMVKNAVQNVFVYSFTRMFQSHPAEKEKLLAIIPMTLYSLYIAQVCHKGC